MARFRQVRLSGSLLLLMVLTIGVDHSFAGEHKSPGPPRPSTVLAQAATPAPVEGQAGSPEQELPPGGTAVEDLLLQKGLITMDEWIRIKAEQEYRSADQARRIDAIEDWKERTELLPILRDKVNFGLNALQFLYGHSNAQVPEGKSQDSFSIRRAELIFWGKISDTIPRWHTLFEFQSTNLTSNTPTNGTSTPSSTTNFREAYIDFRPIQSWAPNLNYFRMGIFRMPWGIFTETSGGLRDIISSP
ncbi:MAG TPA: porin, partial [Nitrospiraceae bacterium]